MPRKSKILITQQEHCRYHSLSIFTLYFTCAGTGQGICGQYPWSIQLRIRNYFKWSQGSQYQEIYNQLMAHKLIQRQSTRIQTSHLLSFCSRRFSTNHEEEYLEERMKLLMETSELETLLNSKNGQDNLKIIDASWVFGDVEQSPQFKIPLSQTIEMKDINGDHSKYIFTIPTLNQFIKLMRRRRIKRTDNIVCYDQQGIYSSARVAWTLRYFGAENVRVLNGGLKKWLIENRPVDQNKISAKSQKLEKISSDEDKDYKYTIVNTKRGVQNIEEAHKLAYYKHNGITFTQIIDARSEERYSGKVKERDSTVRTGIIPGATNFYYKLLVNEDGSLMNQSQMNKIFANHEIESGQSVVVYSGRGIGASVVDLGLQCLGNKMTGIYPGSWLEYGSHPEPNMNHGHWNTPVPQLVDQSFRSQGEDRYNQYLTYKEHEIKQRKKQDDEYYHRQELAKMFPKHLYDSGEEESDYELEDKDMQPMDPRKRKG